MAETPKIEIKVEGNDLVIRTGAALPLKEPNIVDISGVITAPVQYITGREDYYEPKESLVTVDTRKGSIRLILNEKDFYSDTIEGVLETHADLHVLQINKDKLWTPNELVKVLKRFKFYFKNPSEHESFLTSLINFTADVTTKIKSARDNKGNSLASIERQVTNSVSMPKFTLDIPLFKGMPKVVFGVEVCVDATDSDLRYYLESIDLFMLIETEKEKLLKSQADLLSKLGYPVIYLS